MRKQINTMDINKAYREVEIKSAVLIGLDYGLEVEVTRNYRADAIVRLKEIYTDNRKWAIEEVVIQFINNSEANTIDNDLRNKIRILHTGFSVATREREYFKIEVCDTWNEALETIMEIVWNIEEQE